MDRERLRAEMKTAREHLAAADGAARSEAACRFLAEYLRAEGARTVLFYAAIRGEADPAAAVRALCGDVRALYPRVEGADMVAAEGARVPGAFGIPEPGGQALTFMPDAVIVPLLAADDRGYRLGWGKGYYDRYLAGKTCKKIGFCYDFQIVPRLPEREWDERLTAIVTDKRIIEVKL